MPLVNRTLRLFLLVTLLFGLTLSLPSRAELTAPSVHGFGVKSCQDYLVASRGWEAAEVEQVDLYMAYRDWLSGLVTGLSLATGIDVLQGVEVEGAMRRIKVYCEDHPADDFFTASMDLIKTLSKLHQES